MTSSQTDVKTSTLTCWSFHENVALKNGQNEIVFDRLWYPMSILLLAALGAKLIGHHGGLQVDKQKVCQVTVSVDSPLSNISVTVFVLLDKRFIGVIPRECHPEKRPK